MATQILLVLRVPLALHQLRHLPHGADDQLAHPEEGGQKVVRPAQHQIPRHPLQSLQQQQPSQDLCGRNEESDDQSLNVGSNLYLGNRLER